MEDRRPRQEQQREDCRSRDDFVRERERLWRFVARALGVVALLILLTGILPVFIFLYFLDAARLASDWRELVLAPPMWTILLVGLIFIAEVFFHFRRQRVSVGRDGIVLRGFLCARPEEFLPWTDIVRARVLELPRNGQSVVILSDRSGKRFVLPMKSAARSSAFSFTGAGHARTLPEAIEHWRGPLTPPDAATLPPSESAPRDMLFWLTGRRGHTLLACVVMAVLTASLANAAGDFLALNVWNHTAFFLIGWLAARFAFWLARFALRHNRAGVLALPVLLAGTTLMLMAPLTILLPVWFGNVREDTFFIGGYRTETAQYWRAVEAPRWVYFQARIPQEARRFDRPGLERRFAVYHGPFGLQSMSVRELDALKQP
ncbi:MAG: hypothetical protein LBO79_05365 [Zoogloeaceae bacterium]|jgi:hypothetical protein|nr:hypothetical protein [Zoogloeaceae bacterium]